MNVDKKKFCAVIKQFHFDTTETEEIKEKLDRVHGGSSSSFKTVCARVVTK